MNPNRKVTFAALTLVLLGAVSTAGMLAVRARQTPTPAPNTSVPLVTGKSLTPLGSQTKVGSYPVNALLSPDHKWMVVTNSGSRQYLSVIDIRNGKLVSQAPFNDPRPDLKGSKEGLFYGLAFGPKTDNGVMLYAGRGSDDKVSILLLANDGKLTRLERTLDTPSGRDPGKNPLHVAGVAVTADGRTLYAANNNGDPATGMNSTVSVVDIASGVITAKVPVPGYPLGVTALTTGPNSGKKVYVGS
jgi:DNA-binding beta-propeller fold protein YncE